MKFALNKNILHPTLPPQIKLYQNKSLVKTAVLNALKKHLTPPFAIYTRPLDESAEGARSKKPRLDPRNTAEALLFF